MRVICISRSWQAPEFDSEHSYFEFDRILFRVIKDSEPIKLNYDYINRIKDFCKLHEITFPYNKDWVFESRSPDVSINLQAAEVPYIINYATAS